MEKPRYYRFFFDMDGTLIDSGDSIMESAAYALEQMGLPVPPKSELRRFIGPPLAVTFPQFGVPAERVDEAIRTYRHLYHDLGGKFRCKPYDGIIELLDRLNAEGWEVYLATSKPETIALEVLDKFGMTGKFRIAAGATVTHERETKDAVIRYLIGRIGSDEGAIMIGDTEFDVTGAAALGLPCVGVSWGFGSRESLEKAAAVADTPAELYDLLTKGIQQ